MLRHAAGFAAVVLAVAWTEPTAAQQTRAGLLTCNVSAGIGLIVGSQKQISCVFTPDQPSWPTRQEDYDGSITKFGLDLGVTGGGVMVWAVFTRTVAGPGFLAGDYVGATGEVTLGAGLGANVLIGGIQPDRHVAAGFVGRPDRNQSRRRRRIFSFGPAGTLTSRRQ